MCSVPVWDNEKVSQVGSGDSYLVLLSCIPQDTYKGLNYILP